jgi:hypothetical protein
MTAQFASATAPSELSAALPAPLRRHLRNARQLFEHPDEASARAQSTGVAALDRLLIGGLRRGQLIELVGNRTCGRYSLVLATLATTTGRGEVAALIDLGDSFDPQSAATAGITLERLLWVRPPHLKQALIAAEAILAAGFPLVALDLGFPPIPGGRGAAAAWVRLARAAGAQESALLVTSPYRVSGTAATAVIHVHRAHPLWSGRGTSPRLLAGMRSHLEVEKLRGHRAGAAETLQLTSNEASTFIIHPPQQDVPAGPRTAFQPPARQAG